MKKAQLIAVVILIAVYIWMRFYAPIIKVALILKHISLFLLLGIIAYNFTTYLLKRIIKRYNPTGIKETLVYIGRSISFGIVIIIFGLFQFSYIEFSETPYTEICRYYDNYNNLVYESMIYESCPNLNVVELTDTVFEFTVSEYSNVYEIAEISPEKEDLSKWDDYAIKLNTTIRIEYDSKNRITNINQQMTFISNIEYSEGNLKTYKYSYQKIVSNDYSDIFESVYKEAEILFEYDGFVDIYTGHNLFEEIDYEIIRYYVDNLDYREIQPEEHSIKTWTYSLNKEYTDENGILGSTYLGRVIVIKENERYRNTFFNEDHDGIDYTYRVDLYHNENEIERKLEKYDTESHNEIDKSIVYSSEFPYTIRSETYSLSTDSIEQSYIEDVQYNQHTENDITYIYSERSNIGLFNYSPYIYGIQKTEYGYQVLHQRYRNQNYFSYLMNGQFSSDKVYFEDARYYYGLRYQVLFNIEYTIDYLANTEDAIYVQPEFIKNTE